MDIPQPGRAVLAGSDNAHTAGAELGVSYRVCVPTEYGQRLTGARIPDASRLSFARGDDMRVIRAEAGILPS